MLLLIAVVIIANIQIYWLQVLVEDDYLYGVYYWQYSQRTILQHILFQGAYLPNRLLCWIAGNVNVYLARTVVLVGIMLPCSGLIFNILRRLRYPLPVAFCAASLIWLFPGQNEIPLFVNGSYLAEALLIMSVSFYAAIKYLDNNNKNNWIWFAFTLVTMFWALNVSEQVVAGAFAICICLLCWKRFDKKVCILSGAMILLVVHHAYFNILHGGRLISRVEPLSLEKLSRVLRSFLNYYLPFPGMRVNIDATSGMMLFYSIFSFGLFTLIIKYAVTIFICKNDVKMSDRVSTVYEHLWRLAFPIVMFLAPLLIMVKAPYFTPRHALFPALGFYLLLAYITYELIGNFYYVNTGLCTVFVIAIIIKHYTHIYTLYSPCNADHMVISRFMTKQQFPIKSQIVVSGANVRTDSYHKFSTGYFIYTLKRKDITGVIGEDFNLNDPFKIAPRIINSKMNSLNLTDPLFIYRKTENGIHQLTYLLQWKQNTINSDFAIYRVDKYTGKIVLYDVGKGWASYLEKKKELAAREGQPTDIMWGADLTESDKKRVGI